MSIANSPLHDAVAQQYEKWPYPRPLFGLDALYAKDFSFDRLAFWPRGDRLGTLEVLVAGCGANQAAGIACHNPNIRVVGIDVSSASLAHERRLKKTYRLDNLELHQLPIEEAAALDRDFDLIFAHGVLLHMENPAQGLSTLRRLLRPEGSMSLMVYGKHGRAGVTMLQELFSSLGVGQREKDVEFVKQTVQAIPDSHPAASFARRYADLTYGSGVVDLFLHPREGAFTVDECLDFLDEGEMQLQTWHPNTWYYPDAYVPVDHPLYQALDQRTEREIWRAMELFRTPAKHQFIVCRAERPKATFVIDFDSAHIGAMLPSLDPRWSSRSDASPPRLDWLELQIFRHFDGQTSLEECVRRCAFQGSSAVMMERARNMTRRLWRAGLIRIQLPPDGSKSCPS